MITEFVIKKKPKIPVLTLIFVICCLLVSVPTFFNAELYEVFGGEKPMFYFWQPVTNFFEHGTSISFATLVSLPLHIAINLALLVTFGVVCEKLLGAKRYFLLIVSTAILSRAVGYLFDTWGNGASSVTWAFAPIAFYFTRVLFKKDSRSLMKDWMFYVFCFLFFMAWIVITLFDILYGAYKINIFHLFATITGTVFLFIFKKSIAERIDEVPENAGIQNARKALSDKLVVGAFLIIPAAILLILALWTSGKLTNHVSSSKIEETTPQSASVDALNESGEVRIRFTESMKREIMHSSVTVNSDEQLPPVTHELEWLDEKTVRITFSRAFKQGETVSIQLRGFRDLAYRKFYDTILLEYGFE